MDLWLASGWYVTVLSTFFPFFWTRLDYFGNGLAFDYFWTYFVILIWQISRNLTVLPIFTSLPMNYNFTQNLLR